MLKQADGMFKMNTDTHLLGEYLTVRKNETVLDIGTNNGALLLYASRFNYKELIGVDINEKAISLAEENMKYNGVKASLFALDVRELKINQVDVIICNPPYFNYRDTNKNVDLKNARHETTLNLDDLFRCYNSLLKDSGRVYMIHRSQRIIEIINTAAKYNLKINKMQFVYDKRCKNAKAVLLEIRKGKSGLITVEEAKYI